jgi:uncharacterized membrane protein
VAELIVVGFQGTRRATEVLDQLQQLNAESLIDLKDGVAAYRTDDGRLRIDQSLQPTTREEAVWGGLLGAFVGVLLATPFAVLAVVPFATGALALGGAAVGGVTGGVAGFDDAAKWKEECGITDEFVKRVGGMIQSGNSAVFVLARVSDPDDLAERFRGYGGTVLRTTLPPESTRKLQEALAAPSEQVVR